MGDSINNDSLWFLDETIDNITYSEGGLASQIFEYVDKKIIGANKDVIDLIKESVPIVSEVIKGLKKNETFKIVFSDEVQKKLNEGTYKFMKIKDSGDLFKAIVVDEKGKTREIGNIIKESAGKGVDFAEITKTMQANAIQAQLRDISHKLDYMSKVLDDVVAGQNNDRIAHFLSGEAMYREALLSADPELKKRLTSNAIQELTYATASLQMTLVKDINEIISNYDREKQIFVGDTSQKIQQKMSVINSALNIIHKSNTLKVAIYYNEGEYRALTTVLSDYKNFLLKNLTRENAYILYLADKKEMHFNGTWNFWQSGLPKKIDDTRLLLLNPQNYALEMKEE